MMEFEHRQTADDDEGMDLCKKKSLLQSATCIEGGGPPGSHHRFFLLTILDHHAPRISYLELATTTILLRSITQKKQIS